MALRDSNADPPSQPARFAILDHQYFVELINQRVGKLLWIARFLSAWQPHASALTRPLVADLISHARQIEELLDGYGARNNRQWCRFRSLVATIKLFAEATYELLHIQFFLTTYQLLPIERDFSAATADAIQQAHEVMVTASNWLLAEAERLGLNIPTNERRVANYSEQLAPGRLAHDRPARTIDNVAEIVTYLASAYLNSASESQVLNIPDAGEGETVTLPETVSEDNLRFLKVRFHCLQSLYDTYVSETAIECMDAELPTLRGHISIVFHLLEIATYLAHYYERHLNIHTGDPKLQRKPVIGSEALLYLLLNYAIVFAGLYLSYGQRFCYTLLKRYAEIGRVEVAAPTYRGFHVRPSTLIARIVRHYGSDIVMELEGQSYDAATPLDIFRANEKINARKRRWLASEIAAITLPAGPVSNSQIKATILDIVVKLVRQRKIIVYQQPLNLSEEFNNEGLLLETVTNELTKLQATGQLEIKTELTIAFVGDKRVLSDLELLAKAGYGEDCFGNNIALPKELAYLHR